MVDYSVWNNIELSDDSDIETHPNVDTESLKKWRGEGIRERRREERERKEFRAAEMEQLKKEIEERAERISESSLDKEEKTKIKQELEESRSKLKALAEEARQEEEEEKKHPVWHIENMCKVVEERTLLNTSKDEASKNFSTPSTKTNSSQELGPLTKEEEDLLTKYANIKGLKEIQQFLNIYKAKVVKQSIIDKLFSMAYLAMYKDNEEIGKHFVHQALILQYLLPMSSDDGIYWFFKKLRSNEEHESNRVFQKDLEDRIELIKTQVDYRKAGEEDHTSPPVTANTNTSSPASSSSPSPSSATAEQDLKRKEVLQSLPEEVKKALQEGDNEKLNEVLASMKASEAKRIVKECEEAGILASTVPHDELEKMHEIREFLESIPPGMRAALEERSARALNAQLALLDFNEGKRIVDRCRELGILAKKSKEEEEKEAAEVAAAQGGGYWCVIA